MPFSIAVLGTSLGGLRALKTLLQGLRPGFPLAMAIVQHQGHGVPGQMARLLQPYCALPVAEPEDKEAIVPGHVYLAPPGYHLLVEPGSFALTTEAPVLYARPSIDVLFESAADSYRTGTIGIVLTASSRDGVSGMARIKERGGLTIVQDPAEAESRVLPDAVLGAVKVDHVLPLRKIAPVLALASHLTRASRRSGEGERRRVG